MRKPGRQRRGHAFCPIHRFSSLSPSNISSHKLDDLATDPHVNLAYYHVKSREWVPVSGIEAQSVEYLVVTQPKPVVLFELVKGMVTGSPPKLGDQRSLTDRELEAPAAHEAR